MVAIDRRNRSADFVQFGGHLFRLARYVKEASGVYIPKFRDLPSRIGADTKQMRQLRQLFMLEHKAPSVCRWEKIA